MASVPKIKVTPGHIGTEHTVVRIDPITGKSITTKQFVISDEFSGRVALEHFEDLTEAKDIGVKKTLIEVSDSESDDDTEVSDSEYDHPPEIIDLTEEPLEVFDLTAEEGGELDHPAPKPKRKRAPEVDPAAIITTMRKPKQREFFQP